jgi:hypothetical protein
MFMRAFTEDLLCIVCISYLHRLRHIKALCVQVNLKFLERAIAFSFFLNTFFQCRAFQTRVSIDCKRPELAKRSKKRKAIARSGVWGVNLNANCFMLTNIDRASIYVHVAVLVGLDACELCIQTRIYCRQNRDLTTSA